MAWLKYTKYYDNFCEIGFYTLSFFPVAMYAGVIHFPCMCPFNFMLDEQLHTQMEVSLLLLRYHVKENVIVRRAAIVKCCDRLIAIFLHIVFCCSGVINRLSLVASITKPASVFEIYFSVVQNSRQILYINKHYVTTICNAAL